MEDDLIFYICFFYIYFLHTQLFKPFFFFLQPRRGVEGEKKRRREEEGEKKRCLCVLVV